MGKMGHGKTVLRLSYFLNGQVFSKCDCFQFIKTVSNQSHNELGLSYKIGQVF